MGDRNRKAIVKKTNSREVKSKPFGQKETEQSIILYLVKEIQSKQPCWTPIQREPILRQNCRSRKMSIRNTTTIMIDNDIYTRWISDISRLDAAGEYLLSRVV